MSENVIKASEQDKGIFAMGVLSHLAPAATCTLVVYGGLQVRVTVGDKSEMFSVEAVAARYVSEFARTLSTRGADEMMRAELRRAGLLNPPPVHREPTARLEAGEPLPGANHD